MHLLMLALGLVGILAVSCLLVTRLKNCRLPRRKPRIWKEAAAVLLCLATPGGLRAADSFLANISIAPVGVVNIDPSNASKEWGAGVKLDYQLNKTVSLQLGLLAYENWKGSAIDETPVEVKAILFGSANKGANLYAIGGVDRSWRYDDWGMKGGLGLEFRLAKQLSVFGEATYDVWNKGPDRIQVPFGLRLRW